MNAWPPLMAADPYDDLATTDVAPEPTPGTTALDPARERDRLLAHLRGLGRDVFKEVTADLLQGRPSPDAISAFSQRYPDRWAQALAVAARLSGYTEKIEIDTNLYVELTQMSDAQLEQRLRSLEARLGARLMVGAGTPTPRETLGDVLEAEA